MTSIFDFSCIITLFGLMTSSTHLSGTPVINSTGEQMMFKCSMKGFVSY